MHGRVKTHASVREYFTNELKDVLSNQKIQVQDHSFEYLVSLLLRYMESEKFFVKNEEGKLQNNVLFDLYAQSFSGGAESKAATLRRLGDICLLISGFFSDSLKKKLIDIDYYHGMGCSAYSALSSIQPTRPARETYQELSTKFTYFSEVLEEMSERSGITSNADLLRLYEKWLITKSDRLRSVLSQHGITSPISINEKKRQ